MAIMVGDIALLARPSPDEARELAARFLDLEHHEPRLINSVVISYPRVPAPRPVGGSIEPLPPSPKPATWYVRATAS